MTIVSTGWEIRAEFAGKDDSVQAMTGQMTATVFADVETDAAIVLTAWQGVSAGALKGYTLSQKFADNAFVRTTSDDAEGGESAYIVTGIEGNPFKSATINIPFPKATLFVDTVGQNRNVIDIDALAIDVLIAKYSTGGQLYISDGEIADTVLRGQRDV